MSRRLRTAGFWALALALSVLLAVVWLPTTTGGARVLAAAAGTLIPALEVDVDGGSLLHGLDLRRVRWRDAGLEVEIRRLSSRWRARCLLQARWCVHDLSAAEVVVTLSPTPGAAPAAPGPVTLPSVSVPLEIELDALRVARLRVVSGETDVSLDDIDARLALTASGLHLVHLSAAYAPGSQRLHARVSGTLALHGDYPLDLQLDAALRTAPGETPLPGDLDLNARLGGSLADLTLSAGLSGVLALELEGSARPLAATPAYELRATWRSIAWPPAQPGVSSDGGELRVRGAGAAYELTLDATLGAGPLRDAAIALRADGDATALEVRRLALDAELLRAETQGRLTLQPAPAWAGDLALHHLALDPWLTGAAPLSGRTGVRASAGDDGIWRARFDGLDLQTALDGHPLSARASLTAGSDGRVDVDALVLASGSNELRGRGALQAPLAQAAAHADVRLDWTHLRWPPAGMAEVHSYDGQVHLDGAPEDFRAELATRIEGPQIPAAALAATLRGNGERVALTRLGIDTLGGRIDATGTLALGDRPRFDGRIELADLDLTRWWPQFSGPLGGRARVSASAPDAQTVPVWRLALDDTELRAQVTGFDVELRTALSATADGRVDIATLSLASGDSRLEATGRLDTAGLTDPAAVGAESGTRLRIDWQQLAWPPTGAAVVRALDGHAELGGGLGGYDMAFETRLEAEGAPPAGVSLRATGDRGMLRIDTLVLSALGGEARARATLALTGTNAWQAEVDLAGIDPGAYWEALPGELRGRVAASGAFPPRGWTANLAQLELEGTVLGQPLSVRGALRGAAAGDGTTRFDFDDLNLVSGDNRVTVHGGLDGGGWALRGKANLPRPGNLVPDLEGDIDASFSVRGATGAPDVDLVFDARALRYRELSVSGVTASATLAALGQAASSLTLQANELKHQDRHFEQIRLEGEGSRTRHSLRLSATGPVLGFGLSLRGTSSDTWQGVLDEGEVSALGATWRLGAPLPLTWDAQREALQIEAHCWRDGAASLCLREAATVGRSGHLVLALEALALGGLTPLLTPGVDLTGTLNANATLGWRPGAPPELALTASADGAALSVDTPADAPMQIRFATFTLSANAVPARASAAIAFDAGAAGRLRAELTMDMSGQARVLGGRLRVSDVDLAALRPFFPHLGTLAGRAEADGTLGGTLAAPRFVGTAQIRALEVAITEPPLRVHQGELSLRVNGARAEIDGRARLGEGELRLAGAFDWSADPWSLELAVDGEAVALSYPPLVREVVLAPQLQISVRPRHLRVQGQVHIPRARVVVRDLPEGATAVSRDVVVIEEERARGEDDWVIETRVRVILGEDVRFTGLGLSARLSGDVELAQGGNVPVSANGEIRVLEGTYTAYGQDLTITRGRLLFVGSLEHPDVNARAVRRVGAVTAGLQLSGPLTRPRITLFSEPPQSETNTLAYIVLGRPLESESPEDNRVVAAAALSLGVRGGRDFAARIAEQLGIQDFEIGAQEDAETGDTQLVLSGRLSPNLAVRYGVGVFTPENTLTLRYDLTRSLYVEAAQGVESALDFFYSFTF